MAYVSAEARREQLIEAAVRVIAREGADGATTRKIADEAKAPLASLHYCFQNKENLLLAVFAQLSEEMPVSADLSEAEDASLGHALELCLTGAMRWSVENPVRARAMIEVTLWAERYDPELSVGFYATFLRSSEAILSQVDVPLSGEELQSVLRVTMGLVDGLSLQLFSDGDKERTLRDTATACAMLKAFLNESARETA
ncbi:MULTISPECIES: TetR/AcrR family transcriptional regulator [Streptomyces]|jgi:AcrR family transcriptional regulator|uniref:AcrR family transcriptional regulator n=1 Tax=Streptomyces nymphaeiformis TaxID=2663842 RepID=A0A7W7XBS1_9ACTN|nr:TetR family transcriptional regulator [Streptomyces nymphaeiformis]MBB4981676.1 AcrR family transcriptional regulator [Streptomyces nymphaeiformis]